MKIDLRMLLLKSLYLNKLGLNVFPNVHTFCVGIVLKNVGQSFKGPEETPKTFFKSGKGPQNFLKSSVSRWRILKRLQESFETTKMPEYKD